MFYSSGNVRKRKDKKGQPWQGVLRYKKGDKWHEVKKSFSSAKSKGEAQTMLKAWWDDMEKKAQQDLKDKPETTVADAIRVFLKRQHDLGILSNGTFQRQMSQVENAIEPYFDGMDFYSITRNDVSDYIHETSLRYSAQAVRNYYSLILKTYKEAIRNGQIETNPCELQNLPKIPEHRINYLDLEGRKKFLAQINQLEPSDYRYIVGMLAYYTGMRASEIAALQWSDINFAVNRIYVTKAASTIKDAHGKNIVEIKQTKSKAGKRSIPLAPQAKEALLNYLDGKEPKPTDTILEKKRCNPSNLCGCFLSWSRSRGIIGVLGKPITLHGLRHTFATVAVQSNADIKSLASMLGHSRADITLNIYASDDEQAKEQAMNNIAAFWNNEEVNDF